MENSFKYTVAGHTFEVSLPSFLEEEKVLSPYLPFKEYNNIEPLFRLRLDFIDSLKALEIGEAKEVFNDEAPFFWLFDKEGKYNFGFSNFKSNPDCLLVVSDHYTDNVVYLPTALKDKDIALSFALSNSMMLLYTFCTSPLDTLMVHASVIGYEGGAYIFLGKSGTGKSTHSSLWLKNIEGSELINDDNPVIRVVDGKAILYGTPWSGKTPCYRNVYAPLKAFVRIIQAPHNEIKKLIPLQAYASLLPSCSCMRWDSKACEAVHKTVEKVVGTVPAYALECLPNDEAAILSYKTIVK